MNNLIRALVANHLPDVAETAKAKVKFCSIVYDTVDT